MKNQLKEELKTLLVGKEFKEDDYNQTLLNNMLKDFNVEVNLWDFDFALSLYLYYITFVSKRYI